MAVEKRRFGGHIWEVAPLGENHQTKAEAVRSAKNTRFGGYFARVGKIGDRIVVFRRWSSTTCPKECAAMNVLGRKRT